MRRCRKQGCCPVLALVTYDCLFQMLDWERRVFMMSSLRTYQVRRSGDRNMSLRQIGLCQRWPKAVFQVMRERSVELEDLRRKAYMSSQPAYRYTGRGYCPVCKTKSDHGLDTHMMCHHLDLGQLWRCPVEWCAVWKGSVRECRDHFNEKHSSSETIDFDKVSKAFPAWTVTRDFWKQALRPEISGIAVDVMLFRESGRRLVHKYRVYRDPLPHPALREGKISKLISLANRAMAIAQLTQLRIAIPASGSAPGEIPMDCFPGTKDVATSPVPKWVSFATMDQMQSVQIETTTAEMGETPPVKARVTGSRETSPVPPPGFRTRIGLRMVNYNVIRDCNSWRVGRPR